MPDQGRRGFTPRFVVSRDAAGVLRRLAFEVPPADPFPDDLRSPGGITFPHVADVILRQRRGAGPAWSIEDRLQRRLSPVTFGTFDAARVEAATIAASRQGDLWVWSDEPPRFAPVS